MKTCKVDGCLGLGHRQRGTDNRYMQLGYCVVHYGKYKKYGDALFEKNRTGENREKNPLRSTYLSMKNRCYNINNRGYKNRGGRGITVCERRLGIDGFANFLSDMGDRPNGTSLDRIDCKKGYSPNNCRRATIHQQAGNRRTNNEIVGVTKCRNTRKAQLILNKVKYQKYFKEYEDAVKYRKELEKIYLGKNI